MQFLMNLQHNTFITDVQDYVRSASVFLDRELLEIMEKDFDFHNMAFTHYSDGRFVSAMSYVTNVPTSQVMLMRREYYRVGYFRNDDLAHYVTSKLALLPSYRDCEPIRAKDVLTSEQFRNYANFFAPYQIQDAVVLPLDADSRITIFHKNDLPPWNDEDLFTFTFLQKILQMAYGYWKQASREKQLVYMKDRVINDHRIGLALFDEDMNLVECNSLFFEAVAELYKSSDLKKNTANLLVAVARGESEIGRYLVRFDRSDYSNSAEKKRAYSCIYIEERKPETPAIPTASERKNTRQANRINLLTDREVEVMTRYCSGRTAKQIAQDLFISEWTVKAHIKSIYKKLNVSNQRQLISEYLQTRIG